MLRRSSPAASCGARGAPRRAAKGNGRSLDAVRRFRAVSDSGAPRERVSTLIAAIRRVSATLDLDTVLGEVLEGARALTGARKGVIVTLDEAGAPRDPVFSGLTPEEQREQLAWPGNARLFEHLRSRPGPLRVADFPDYVRALGIESPWTISRTFQGMPMRHRGEDAGSFSLSDKADGEAFTAEDEEVLALFASQAAAAIANARAHESERRAPGRPGGPGRDLADRGGGLRCEEWPGGVVQPRGAAESSRACARRAIRPSSSWR